MRAERARALCEIVLLLRLLSSGCIRACLAGTEKGSTVPFRNSFAYKNRFPFRFEKWSEMVNLYGGTERNSRCQTSPILQRRGRYASILSRLRSLLLFPYPSKVPTVLILAKVSGYSCSSSFHWTKLIIRLTENLSNTSVERDYGKNKRPL